MLLMLKSYLYAYDGFYIGLSSLMNYMYMMDLCYGFNDFPSPLDDDKGEENLVIHNAYIYGDTLEFGDIYIFFVGYMRYIVKTRVYVIYY